jgi:hypothetical protein
VIEKRVLRQVGALILLSTIIAMDDPLLGSTSHIARDDAPECMSESFLKTEYISWPLAAYHVNCTSNVSEF